MHTGASYRRSRVITGPSHLGVYGPCVFIRCVIEKAKKTAQLGSKSSAFDGRVLLGLDRLGLNPVSQRHVTSGSCAGVWLIGCDPTDETDRCCSECGAAGRVRSSWRRRLYLVKSMFRVSSLIFLAGGVFLCFCQLLGELTCRDSGWLSWARFALPVASGVLSRVARFRLRGLVPGRGFRF